MADWFEVCLTVGDEATAEQLALALRPHAEGESVALEQLGDPNDLNPCAMLPDVRLKLYLSAQNNTAVRRQAITHIAQQFNTAHTLTITPLQPTDWANAWKAHYKPLRLGQHFWVVPSWETPPASIKAEDFVLNLDPSMAFGTGKHATTQLCFALLETLVQPHMRVLDVGTGSGILAIAAAKLGATVLAIDTDPLAITAAQENIILNGVDEQITVREGSLSAVPERNYDLVLVNILARIIMPMLTNEALLTYAHPDHGRIIFSGIIQEQLPQFRATLQAAGGHLLHQNTQSDWVALLAAPNKKAPAQS